MILKNFNYGETTSVFLNQTSKEPEKSPPQSFTEI